MLESLLGPLSGLCSRFAESDSGNELDDGTQPYMLQAQIIKSLQAGVFTYRFIVRFDHYVQWYRIYRPDTGSHCYHRS
ncbi:hypothetical protein WG66_009227 [Moniliophthora roreri]|nr:hypothetical protein WG66_009227 [Moniliophthora roreri]